MATISSGTSLSAAVSLAVGKPAGVQLPASIDGATALTFQVSYDGGVSYANFYDAEDSEYSIVVAASRAIGDATLYARFLGATHVKVRLGTSGSPVTATADRSITLALVP